MKKLVILMILLIQPVAEANTSVVEKLYQKHFEKVKVTLAVMYGKPVAEIQPGTLFTNVNSRGGLIGIEAYSMNLAMISYNFAQENFDPQKVKNELLIMEPREGCEIVEKKGHKVFQFDAECISRALYYSKMTRA